MIDIYNASLTDILPQSLKIDSQFTAIAKALDPLLKKFAVDTRKAMHLPRLDELEGLILDVLADQFHCDYYNSATLTDGQKRNLIRNSIALHRLKGTVYAVEYVVNQFFQNATVEELEGFLFKINAGGYTAAPEAFDTFARMLFDVKPVRSWLVGIDLDLSPPQSAVYVGNLQIDNEVSTVGLNLPTSYSGKLSVGCPIMFTESITIHPRS